MERRIQLSNMKTIIKTKVKAQLFEQGAASEDLRRGDLGGCATLGCKGNPLRYPHFHSCEEGNSTGSGFLPRGPELTGNRPM